LPFRARRRAAPYFGNRLKRKIILADGLCEDRARNREKRRFNREKKGGSGRMRRLTNAAPRRQSCASRDMSGVIGLPGWRVHQLKGDRAGTWSISVSGNWRITFDIEQGEVCNLNLEDYH
jgi:plasmid maintenance system killer protein